MSNHTQSFWKCRKNCKLTIKGKTHLQRLFTALLSCLVTTSCSKWSISQHRSTFLGASYINQHNLSRTQQFLAIMNRVEQVSLCWDGRPCFGNMHRSGIPRSWGRLTLNILRIFAYWFSQWLECYKFALQEQWVLLLHILRALAVTCVVELSFLSGLWWNLLMANDTEHIFKCVSSILDSSTENSV